VFAIFADHAQNAATADDFTFVADALHGSSDFHTNPNHSNEALKALA
jgi:hypothetical protein